MVHNSIGEESCIALYTHDEGTILQIVLGVGLVPHGCKEIVHVPDSAQVLLHAPVEALSILCPHTVEHLVVGLDLTVTLGDDGTMYKNEAVLVSAAIKHAHSARVLFESNTLWRQDVVVMVLKNICLWVIEYLPVRQSIAVTILE